MNNNDILHKEIDLVQSCIARMASNSFMCKGWLLSLIVAIIVLLPENLSRFNMCILVLCIDICFWWLDSYYLQQEKLYRWKYEWIIINRHNSKNFLYDLNPYNKSMWINSKARLPFLSVMFSKTIFPMYGGIFISTLLLIIFKYH